MSLKQIFFDFHASFFRFLFFLVQIIENNVNAKSLNVTLVR